MGSPGFRQLSKAEYEALSLEQRIAYMRELAEHVHRLVEETRKQIDARDKKLHRPE